MQMTEGPQDAEKVAEEAVEKSLENVDEGRRATLGKLALWTPPAMLSLMLSQRASAAS